MMFTRRKASQEELADGERQIREAEERMRREGLDPVVPGRAIDESPRAMVEDGLVTPRRIPLEDLGSFHGEAPGSSRSLAPDMVAKVLKPEAKSEDEETELREAEIEDEKKKRRARVEGEVLPKPLFTEDQLRRMEELQMKAPMLLRPEPEIPRPRWMVDEEDKFRKIEEERERIREIREQERIARMLKDEQRTMMAEKMKRLEEENHEVKRRFEAAERENAKIREKMKAMMESPFRTPEEARHGDERKEEEEENKEEGEGGLEREAEKLFGDNKKDVSVMSMELMMKMMESMQKMMGKKGLGGSPEVELVRSGQLELPRLPEWSADSAPLDLGDWFIMIEPVMGDLSPTSHLWWQLVMEEARGWYGNHQSLSPLDRVSHKPSASGQLQEARWSRLERRASSLLLASLPDSQKEEMVATKNLTPLAMVARLMTVYQPGGLSEKAIILKALEQPMEATCLSSALVGLRRWLRWKRRATEVQVALPDASVLVKGLNKLVKKVLDNNKELGFRINLAKTTLMVESVPRAETVHQLAEHLVAEIEAIAHLEFKNQKVEKSENNRLAIKKFEESQKGGEKGGQRWQNGGEKSTPLCRFFTTEAGCKKGKACSFGHVLDEQRRCWNCGSTQHYAPKCDRPRDGEGKGLGSGEGKGVGKGEGKTAKMAKTEGPKKNEEEAPKQEEDSTEVMKGLLVEANKMLKAISAPKGVETEKEGRLEKLQKQLDELKLLKVFRVSRLVVNSEEGLIDSGATHALRGWRKGDEKKDLKDIQVTLACGRKKELKMSQGGTMISLDTAIEPIVPMGKMISVLGWKVEWTKNGGLVLSHPLRGPLEVRMRGGCPYIDKEMALNFIEELECEGQEDASEEDQEAKKMEENASREANWIEEFVENHPVLKMLPLRIKKTLKKSPVPQLGVLPGVNKRLRRKWSKKGVVIHLYSGEKTGLSLGRAVLEARGDDELLYEIDIKNGEDYDMLKDHLYQKLLRMVMDGWVEGVVCGPNCRTRSMLRHIPKPGAPRPVRDWEGGEWGSERNTLEEDQKVFEDDVMMWRAILLGLLAIHVRRTQVGQAEDVKFLLEQPAEPTEFPEVVSLWRTKEWKRLKEMYQWQEATFSQGDWGGKTTKPTTVGGNLELELPTKRMMKRSKAVQNSKELERWAPGMMREVAKAIITQIQEKRPGLKLKKIGWEEHLQNGHTPFRRDCYVCQQSRQKQNPHRRVKRPLSGVLSLDTAGPYRDGHDLVMTSRYLVVGTFTWAVPKGSRGVEEPEANDLPEEAPAVELWKDNRKKDEDEGGEKEGNGGVSPRMGPHKGEHEDEDGEDSPRMGPLLGEIEEEEEQKDQKEEEERERTEEEVEWEVRVFRMVSPVATKKAEETLQIVMEMILRLRADGYWVSQVHTDQGHEYYGQLKSWCLKRGILVTRTPGDDPQGNGRAEVAIQGITRLMRASLLQAQVGWEWWPIAARHVNERLRAVRVQDPLIFPPMLEEILVRKRRWRRGVLLEPTCEKVKYLCPAWDHHGHWVLKEDGTKAVARYYLRRLNEPVSESVWVALEKEVDDALNARRRLREKTSPMFRCLQGEDKGRENDIRIMRLIEEEMFHMIEEKDEVLVRREMNVIKKLKKEVEEPWEEEEVLQTKIVSQRDVQREWRLWAEAAKSEIESLIKEKEALEEIDHEEMEKLKERAYKEGKKVEVIPSKVVFTRKPGPRGGKPKVRWVVCGNYEEKKEGEENFSSGADATAFRVMIWMASQRQWHGASVDVKTAFLNAEWGGEDDSVVVVKPPTIFTENEALPKGKFYLPKRAVYGFRRSPRLWGNCRDKAMEEMDIEVQDEKGGPQVLMLRPLDSEPNLWKVVKRDEDPYQEEETLGLVMTYVDDIFMVGAEKVVNATMEEFRRKWKTSEPEEVGEKALRFLGMEVMKQKNERGDEMWMITQQSYLQDLLQKDGGDKKKRRIPITRDMAAELLVVDEEPTAEAIKAAQKVSGELLWLLTRSRPDLMYVMARMCSCVTKNPQKVVEIGEQVKGYLLSTLQEGLKFEKEEEEGGWEMKVFSDASFSPEGTESHGTVVVMLGSCPISWRSSRQSMITLSTAESELLEIVEGFALGEATAVLVEEIVGEITRAAFTDSQSAQAVMVNEGGSWRTRHLRMKSAFARELIRNGVWSLHHIPGEDMVADLGTKALTSTRMGKLKKELGMIRVKGGLEEVADTKEKEKVEDEKRGKGAIPKEVEGALKLVMLMIQLKETKAQGEETRQGEVWFWSVVSLAMVGLVFIIYQLVRLIEKKWRRCVEEDQASSSSGGPAARPLRLRRRLLEERSHQSEPSPISTSSRATSQAVHSHIVEGLREVFRRAENLSEPGGEPGTLLEDFRESLVIEEVQHPEEWDVDVQGEFPIGKGSPPPSYFRRMREGKGIGSPVPSHGERDEGEKGFGKGKSEKGKNEKGRSVQSSHGVHEQGVGLTSSTMSPPSSVGGPKGKGAGKQSELPDLCGGKGCGRDPVIITPYGSRFHTRRNCSSLQNSRLLLSSAWCEHCSQGDGGEEFATIAAPGETAHASSVCPRVTLKRVFRKCGLCREMEVHMR